MGDYVWKKFFRSFNKGLKESSCLLIGQAINELDELRALDILFRSLGGPRQSISCCNFGWEISKYRTGNGTIFGWGKDQKALSLWVFWIIFPRDSRTTLKIRRVKGWKNERIIPIY